MNPQEAKERINQYGTAPHHISCCCQPCLRDFKEALRIVREGSKVTDDERQRVSQAVAAIYDQIRPMTGIEKHWAEPETVIEAVDAIRLHSLGVKWEENQ